MATTISPDYFENLDEDTKQKIYELDMLQKSFEDLLMQKHSFSMEINEVEMIINELEKAEGDVFKILGNQVVVKSTKDKLLEDMKKKKELLELRMKNIESQEKAFSENLEKLRHEVIKKISEKGAGGEDSSKSNNKD